MFFIVSSLKTMTASSEINVFAESLDFLFLFILLRGRSPLDPEAHLLEQHVLRSSSQCLSRIYHDRLHSHTDIECNIAEYEAETMCVKSGSAITEMCSIQGLGT